MNENLEIIEAARELYECDQLDIDDDAQVLHTENGYWVQAWVWIEKQ
jgi:hypothetical protein